MTVKIKCAFFVVVAGLVLLVGDHAPPAIAQTEVAAATSTVYVSRPSALAGGFVAMNIHVNGKKVGAIGNGQCMKVSVPPGRHRILGRFPLTLGPPFEPTIVPVDITVGAGSVTYVLITPISSYPSYHVTVHAQAVKAGRRC